ncbi:hypothetical protein [Candidatus Mycobacterium methanotrophicum]|nr:hypothetical protein [Candidatus Mycobacterium methanotrophicum]
MHPANGGCGYTSSGITTLAAFWLSRLDERGMFPRLLSLGAESPATRAFSLRFIGPAAQAEAPA